MSEHDSAHDVEVRPFQRPRSRNRPRRTPKGRQLDLKAVADIEALLIDRPRRRDLLVEHLHLIQDKYGYISSAHLAALAAEMKLLIIPCSLRRAGAARNNIKGCRRRFLFLLKVELGRSVGWGDEVSVRYGVSADRARVLRTGL